MSNAKKNPSIKFPILQGSGGNVIFTLSKEGLNLHNTKAGYMIDMSRETTLKIKAFLNKNIK